jgi:large subunit ribosomal protein L5
MESVAHQQQTAFSSLKAEFGYTNPMQVPHIEKVVISVGVGSTKDKNKIALVADRLAKITGQKPAPRGAKKSVAAFKTRQGDVVGFLVTLRGRRAITFLNKLVMNALPRTRDFRGIARTGIDALGNYTLGIREHTIFPETSDEELRDVFGMAVTIVTTGGSTKEAARFFEHIGLPFARP